MDGGDGAKAFQITMGIRNPRDKKRRARERGSGERSVRENKKQ